MQERLNVIIRIPSLLILSGYLVMLLLNLRTQTFRGRIQPDEKEDDKDKEEVVILPVL